MTSNAQRIVTGCIAVPVLFALILFLPQLNHLAFCIVVFLACALASRELNTLLLHDKQDMKLPLPSWLGVLIPVGAYIEYSLEDFGNITLYTYIFLFSLAMVIEMATGHKDGFKGTRERISLSLLQLTYPNLFAVFFIRLGFFQNAWMWMLTFFALVFSSDTFAYFFGRWFGANNKGVVKVSPNKSVAGFAAGAIIPALIGLVVAIAWPAYYGLNWWQGLLLGLGTAVAGIFGDLVESAMKRSSHIKDSGSAIPGRGGMMDSIDSLAMAAPIYVALLFIFNAAI